MPPASLTVYNRSIEPTQALSGKASVSSDCRRLCRQRTSSPLLSGFHSHPCEVVRSPRPVARLTGVRSFKWATDRWWAESRSLGRKTSHVRRPVSEVPVLGQHCGKAGTLLVMVGATPEHYDKWPASALSRGRGAPDRAGRKSCRTLLASISSSPLRWRRSHSVLGLIRRGGVDVNDFMGVVRKSALYAPMFEKKLSRLENGTMLNRTFPRGILKDVGWPCPLRKGPLFAGRPWQESGPPHRHDCRRPWETWTIRRRRTDRSPWSEHGWESARGRPRLIVHNRLYLHHMKSPAGLGGSFVTFNARVPPPPSPSE